MVNGASKRIWRSGDNRREGVTFLSPKCDKKNKTGIIPQGKETIEGMWHDSFLWPVARENLPNCLNNIMARCTMYCVYYTLHPLRLYETTTETFALQQTGANTRWSKKKKSLSISFRKSQLTDGELSVWFLGLWGRKAPEGRDSNPACETCLMFALPWGGLWGRLCSAAQCRVWVEPTRRTIIGVVFNGSGIGSSR